MPAALACVSLSWSAWRDGWAACCRLLHCGAPKMSQRKQWTSVKELEGHSPKPRPSRIQAFPSWALFCPAFRACVHVLPCIRVGLHQTAPPRSGSCCRSACPARDVVDGVAEEEETGDVDGWRLQVAGARLKFDTEDGGRRMERPTWR